MHQAGIAAADILGEPIPAQHVIVPRVTFLDPEIGSVGFTEETARQAGLWVLVGTANAVSTTFCGFIHGPGNVGLIKLVVDTDRDLLVGANCRGPVGW